MTQKQLDKEINSLEKEIQNVEVVMQTGDSVEFYEQYKQSLEQQIIELLLLMEVEDA